MMNITEDTSRTKNTQCRNLDQELTGKNRSKDTTFHAVYIPPDVPFSTDSDTIDTSRVYSDKNEALKVIREYKTGRLKTFKNHCDAKEYAKTGHERVNPTTDDLLPNPTTVFEKSNNFKTPKPQDLVRFRKLIENGELEQAKNIIHENPRYLVSSGDTPAILQEGCRYNALHIAVKACKSHMCELILNTIGDTSFMTFLYGKEEANNYVDRSEILLDLYLNTPDKGLNETPLHFAAKFGSKDIVRILVSYPQCDKTLRNKYRQMPVDIICSRKCQENEDLKKDIRILLEEQYYVPVLRAEDNTMQATIGQPFSPARPPNLNIDPISPRLEVRAFAGPMAKDRAIEFRKKWKTPPRKCTTPVKKDIPKNPNIATDHSVSLALRLQDAEKGLERVGRHLAEEYDVPWKEYWPFLNDFADLRCPEGLRKLEEYMEKRVETSWTAHQKIMNSLCDKLLNACVLTTDSDKDLENDEFYTPPSSPKSEFASSDDEMSNAEEGFSTFIEGFVPTKVDYAVYNAVPPSVNPDTHPNVYLWQHEMKLAIKRGVFGSNDAGKSRRKLQMTL